MRNLSIHVLNPVLNSPKLEKLSSIKWLVWVGANSLVGCVPTYSAIALQASRVRIPPWGPFPIPSPSLPLHFLSPLHWPIKMQKNSSLKKWCVWELFRVDSFFWQTITLFTCTFDFVTLQIISFHVHYTLHERQYCKWHNRGPLTISHKCSSMQASIVFAFPITSTFVWCKQSLSLSISNLSLVSVVAVWWKNILRLNWCYPS